MKEHLNHDLFDLDREHNRRILHAARTGTPRPSREHHDYDFHHHLAGHTKPTTHTARSARSGQPAGRGRHGEMHRQVLIDIPANGTTLDQHYRPRRMEYDEPPF